MVWGFEEILALLLAHVGRHTMLTEQPISDQEGPLHTAAGRGHIDVVSTLLTRVPFTSQRKASALFSAARNEHRTIVELFLSHSVDTRDSSVLKALLIMGLVHKGIDIHAHKDSALIRAVSGGQAAMVRLLLSVDVEATAFDVDADSLLVRAAGTGPKQIVVMLLDRFETRFTPRAGYALLRAVMAQRHEVVRTLLSARLCVPEQYLDDVLVNLGAGDNPDVVQMLVHRGADMHKWKDQPLRTACSHHHPRVVRVLLSHGGDPRVDNCEFLVTAARGKSSNDAEIVAMLVDYGADAHAQDDLALRHACAVGNVEAVKVLLCRGAKVPARHGEALRTVFESRESAVWTLLSDRATRLSCLLNEAAAPGHVGSVKKILGQGADIHAFQDIALISATGRGHVKVLRLLLVAGAIVQAQENKALLDAVTARRTHTVKLLLSHGADVHARDDGAVMCAIVGMDVNMVKVLLRGGANVHARSEQALLDAVAVRCYYMVELLLSHGADVHAQDDKALMRAIAGRDWWVSMGVRAWRNSWLFVYKVTRERGWKNQLEICWTKSSPSFSSWVFT
ncbi:ankyrin [Gonapodya prolifera JEL478]|uniref:Ankyrin n=1 Tax=Gonapodya prolifera (strain JEL478) TaxID=1344416 RepID=A0A138ZYY8_GONPJ|nr:ankyrin [Gonapodya prolifera JEL478]|eukprot:KXS09628.1 ankyrin [Gonapodya prolifera JEL478]